MRIRRAILIAAFAAAAPMAAHAADSFVTPSRIGPGTERPVYNDDQGYIEPGTLRLSHDLVLEGVAHREAQGYRVADDGISKVYSKTGEGNGPTRVEWGHSLLTEAAARFSRGVFARILFEVQGDYADRFWRPINQEHRVDLADRHAFVREAEARVERDQWWLRAFEGVGHDSWEMQGDFFRLYPAAFPDDDYLRHSGYFGVYPESFRQNLFLNISGRRVPSGVEAGGSLLGFDGAVAYGEELGWGLEPSAYARLSTNFGKSRVTLTAKDEQLPDSLTLTGSDDDTHNRAAAVAWDLSTEDGQRWRAGVLYNPYRTGDTYQIARSVAAGTGLQGSSWDISERRANDGDALGARLRLDRHSAVLARDWTWSLDLQHLEVLAGNKQQMDLRLATDLVPRIRGNFHYMYRRPVEGPIPFLFEGSPTNIGNIVAQPRGPESPFTVNWSNRETIMMVSTLWYDPTPGTSLLIYDPEVLEAWNLNTAENARMAVAVQHRMTDLRTTIDRQAYYDENGDIQYDSPARAGAWSSDGFLHEFRVLLLGRTKPMDGTLGFAFGQAPATSNAAYSTDVSVNKPITEYYSIEGRVNRGRLSLWAHYGSGIWGPEPFQHFFGESFDRLWGLGTQFRLTTNTTIDLSYLAARQDDTLFVAPDLGAYDELRMIFSHRFGFLLQFRDAARAGYRAR